MSDTTQTSCPSMSTDDLTAEVLKGDLDPSRRGSSQDEVRADLLATTGTLLASHWRLSTNQPVAIVDPKTNIVVHDENWEPYYKKAGRYSRPINSDLGLLKYMSMRDASLAAGVSQGSGNALQCRALFLAANLAEVGK